MPFLVHFCNLPHIKTDLSKLVVDFLSNLKVIQRNAWAYDRLDLSSHRTIATIHLNNSFMGNTIQCSSPSCMNGSNRMMRFVIKKYRYTICRRNANANVFLITHQSINLINNHGLDSSRKSKKFIGNHTTLNVVNLMRHDDACLIDVQFLCQRFLILSNMFRQITTKSIDIEFAIVSFTFSTSSGRRESNYLV